MKSTEQRINNVIGQLEGVKRMLDDGKECTDILTQLKASHSALSALMTGFVEENILERIDSMCNADKQELHRLIKELSK